MAKFGKFIAVALALTMICSVLIMVPSGTSALAPGWTATKAYEKPDPFNSFGAADNSIALDSHGHVHIALSFATTNNNNVLMHVTNQSGSWVSEVVDNTPDVGYYASIAIDSSDHVHIAYYSYNERGLRYATNAGGSWVNQSVVSRIAIEDGYYRADAHKGLSLAIDSSGIPHIAYSSQTNPAGTFDGRHYDLIMAAKVGGVWNFETIDSETGQDLYINKGLVIDSSDHYHVAYSMGNALHYATNMGGSWVSQQLDNEWENGWGDYIALDRQGHICISYLTNNTSPPIHLKYATNASGSWVNETVSDNIGRPTSLGYDPSGQPCIMAFNNIDSRVTLYAKTSGGTWTITNPVGTSTTISVNMYMMADSHGKFHVSYVDYGELWYATDSMASDMNPPSIAITSPSATGSYSTTSGTVTISGTASDDIGVTNVDWNNDRGGSGTATGTNSWSIGSVTLQSGNNVITVTAHDASGKTASTSITVTYTPDTTDPSVTITSPTSSATYTTNVDHISAGDLAGTTSDNVGVTSVTCHNNANGADVSITGTTAWLTATDMPLVTGSNEIVITAMDAAGNSGTDTIAVTYALDTTVPVVSITSPLEGWAANTTDVTVTWTGSDNVGVVGFQYRIDSGTWSPTSLVLSHEFVGLGNGPHNVTVRAIDQANNTATTIVAFVVDTTSPVLSIISPTGNATYATNSSTMTLSGSNSDNVGVTIVTWLNSRGGSGTATISGTNWSAPSIALQEGSNIITVTARDASNNTATTTLTVTYAPDKATSPGIDIGIISILLVLVIVAVLAAFFFVRRRKK